MTREQMFSLAAATMSAAASAITFYLAPILEQSTELKLLALVAGLPGFYLIFRVALWLIGRYQYRHILGTWYYSTKPYEVSSFKDGNFGKMRVTLDSANDLSYAVQLFECFDDLMANKGTQLRGVAHSDAVRYDHQRREIKILYHVKYHADTGQNPSRYGRLFLDLTEDGTLRGHWVSDIDKSTISSGAMIATRPKKFRDALKKEEAKELNELAPVAAA